MISFAALNCVEVRNYQRIHSSNVNYRSIIKNWAVMNYTTQTINIILV